MPRRIIKLTQLWLHRNYHWVRNWSLVVIGVTLLLFSMLMISNQNKLINQIKGLSEQNRNLNEQNNKLGEENQRIAKQNRAYTKCIATIFAQYTHDFVPITITNLDECTIDSQTKKTNDTSAGGTAPSQPTSQPFSSSPANGQASESNQPSSPPPSPPGKSLTKQARDLIRGTLKKVGL